MADIQAQQILQHISDIDQPLNILDIGCGDGFAIHLLSEALSHASITGLDHSEEHIAFAQELTPDQEFTSDLSTDFEYLQGSFDIVYSSLTLHHAQPKDYRQFIDIMDGYLRPEGIGIILEINPWNIVARKEFKNNPEESESTLIWPWKLKRLTKRYGKTSLTFYHIFQHSSGWVTELESLVSWAPLGQLYAVAWIKDDLDENAS
jgi:2-polyprenyl-3-methyl-5-hydroxy-6-metoxy-1,4-benzoquinol methylase